MASGELFYIAVRFAPDEQPIDAEQVTMRGLHGLLFGVVLEEKDPQRAQWLHTHQSPKPFSMAPYFVMENDRGYLAGVRYAVLTEDAASFIFEAWRRLYHSRQRLTLGRYQTFTVAHVECIHVGSYADMARLEPRREMTLSFLSPTAFKQGPGSLPLPLPVNVFRWPLRVWQSYAPMVLLAIPDDWLAWCERNVFVVEHAIQTGTVAITRQERFTGFTGQVTFAAYDGTAHSTRSELALTGVKGRAHYLRVWQALGALAAFSGVGHKTTMGMGAVEKGGL